jgi:hypothetical protein
MLSQIFILIFGNDEIKSQAPSRHARLTAAPAYRSRQNTVPRSGPKLDSRGHEHHLIALVAVQAVL